MAGQIVALTLDVNGDEVARPAIVWDDAVDGDENRWLVVWASTEASARVYELRTGVGAEVDKPDSDPFVIEIRPSVGPLPEWVSVSAHYVASGHLTREVLGEYRANDSRSNSVEIMRDEARRRVVALDEWMSSAAAVETWGAMAADARALERTARERLRVAVLAALAAGESESEAARRAGVDRMTVRKIAGKR